MNAPNTNGQRPRVVIVGGGFGGMEAVKALRNAPVAITMIDRNNHHVFQPLLYQVATAALSPADIAAPIRGVLHNQRNAEVIMAEVTGVDTEKRLVQMHDRTLPYDYLILATGARHSYFGKDQWEKYAPGLKSVTDATTIRRKILMAFEAAEIEPDEAKRNTLLTFVLVGAGPTGVEMAGAIAEIARQTLASDFRHIDPKSARILLIEAGPRILAAFPEDLAQKAQKKLESSGVEVLVNTKVENIDDEGVTASGKRIFSRTVIWTAGVMASPAGRWLNTETDKAGRVLVNADLSVPGHPEIFVIGDTATLEKFGRHLPGVAPVAMQQGRYVGNLLRRKLRGEENVPPFKYFDKGNLATIGRSFAIMDVHGFKLAGFFAWLAWLGIHIFFLIGFRNRLLVMLQWAWAYITFQRGARLITTSADAGPESNPEMLDETTLPDTSGATKPSALPSAADGIPSAAPVAELPTENAPKAEREPQGVR